MINRASYSKITFLVFFLKFNFQLTIFGPMNELQLPAQTRFYKGKVRDVYTINDKHLVMVSSDRISAFDVILPRPIPYKGQVLNQIAAWMLKATADICPNWLLSVPAPNVSIGKKCIPFKIEMVVRGNVTGHAWRTYSSGKRSEERRVGKECRFR